MIDVTENMNKDEKIIFDKYKKRFPFSIFDFVDELGIKFYVCEMLADVSGCISKPDGKYKISVNKDYSPDKKGFTLAHELAHYFNDRDYLERNDSIVDCNKQYGIRREINPFYLYDNEIILRDVKANQWACELLMPEEEFIKIWSQKCSPYAVADYFDVPTNIVRFRAFNIMGVII